MGGHVLATRLRGSHPVSRIPQGGALRLSSKWQFPKEADGREAAAQSERPMARNKNHLRNGSAQRMGKEGLHEHKNAHTETWQSIARRVLVYIYHATASYRIGQQGSKIYNTTLSVAKTLLRGAFIKSNQRKELR